MAMESAAGAPRRRTTASRRQVSAVLLGTLTVFAGIGLLAWSLSMQLYPPNNGCCPSVGIYRDAFAFEFLGITLIPFGVGLTLIALLASPRRFD